jgi:hypothetical protein
VRLAGRVIVLDPGDRALLFWYEGQSGRYWTTASACGFLCPFSGGRLLAA